MAILLALCASQGADPERAVDYGAGVPATSGAASAG
jgi:hypothetical protein